MGIKLTNNELELRSISPKFYRYLVLRRFLTHVKIGKPDECWLWKGCVNDKGYGNFNWLGKDIILAHIAAYELFIGSRHGKCVCHSCDNPPCLILVTYG